MNDSDDDIIVIVEDTQDEQRAPATPTRAPKAAAGGSGKAAAAGGGLLSWLHGAGSPAASRPSAGAPRVTSAPAPAASTASASSAGAAASDASTGATGLSPARLPAARVPAANTSSTAYVPVDSPVWAYRPVQHACWDPSGSAAGSSAPYLHLARAFACMEPVTGRLRVQGMLVNAFRTLLATAPQDALAACCLALGSLGDAMTVGGSTVVSALSDISGAKRETITRLYKDLGDLGDVGERLAKQQRTLVTPAPLTLQTVVRALQGISDTHGPGSAGRKQASMAKLLRGCRESCETRYLVRTFVSNMRIGANAGTIVQALCRAVAANEAIAEAQHQQAGTNASSESPMDASAATGGATASLAPSASSDSLPAILCPAVATAAICDAFPMPAAAVPAVGSTAGRSSASAAATTGKRKRVFNALADAGAASSSSSAGAAVGGDAGDMRGIPAAIAARMDAAADAGKECWSVCPDFERIVTALTGVSQVLGVRSSGATSSTGDASASSSSSAAATGGASSSSSSSSSSVAPATHASSGGLRCVGSAGIAAMVAQCTPTPFTPLRPMLARIGTGIDEVLIRCAGRSVACEWKYDGQRAQIHYDAGGAGGRGHPLQRARVYSRHCDETTSRWPDAVEACLVAAGVVAPADARYVADAARTPLTRVDDAGGAGIHACAAASLPSSEPVTSFIIDAELVAVRVTPSADGASDVRILPFQTLSTRARVLPVDGAVGATASSASLLSSSSADATAAVAPAVRVCVFAFDLLYLNGQSLVTRSLARRRARLRQVFAGVDGAFTFASGVDVVVPATAAMDAELLQEDDDESSAAVVGAVDGSDSGATSSSVSASAADDAASASAAPAGAVVPGYAGVRSRVLAELHAALAGCCEGLMVKLLHNTPAEEGGGGGAMAAAGSAIAGTGSAAEAVLILDSDVDEGDEGAGPPAAKRPRASATQSTVKAAVKAAVTQPAARTAGKASGRSGAAKRGADGASSGVDGGGSAAGPARDWVAATYQPSVRSNSWLKLKKDYLAGMADTIDVVPIGAWWGNGRKAGWFSPILVAVADPESGELQSLCRVMSGFSDAFYRQLTDRYCKEENQVNHAAAARLFATGESPAVWFRPHEVWEVKGADLTLSPVHAAARGLVHPTRGISLRFPRFLRVRDDKGPDDATGGEQVADLYRAQQRKIDVG